MSRPLKSGDRTDRACAKWTADGPLADLLHDSPSLGLPLLGRMTKDALLSLIALPWD